LFQQVKVIRPYKWNLFADKTTDRLSSHLCMSFNQSKWVWMNGELRPWADANIHVSAHALHYGSGVFEGLRCYETITGPAVFQLAAHLNRLYASAEIHGIQIPFTPEGLTAAVLSVIRANDFSSCYVRPLCFYGSDSLGLHPRNCPVEVVIFAWPWGAYLGGDGLEHGVRVTVSPWRKFHQRMMPTTAKACGQYLNSILALREAVSRGYDEALLLDSDDFIAEGSGENIFIVREGKVLTNDEQNSILLGITRDAVIEIARDLGLTVETCPLKLEQLINADEAFFTGTAAEVTPIREVDGQTIGAGRRGPITESIQRIFFAAVQGRDSRYRHWLREVNTSERLGMS
jgi:branched-chain amino acid aminotransferase